MTLVTADNLPWYLIGVFVTALLAVFYAMLRGKIISKSVTDQLLASAEKRAEIAEAGIAANTKSVEALVQMVEKLMVFAENQDKVLTALRASVDLRDRRSRGGGS